MSSHYCCYTATENERIETSEYITRQNFLVTIPVDFQITAAERGLGVLLSSGVVRLSTRYFNTNYIVASKS